MMESTYLPLTYGQVAVAALLLVINAAISIVLRLRLERQLAIAAVRAGVQLTLIGVLLQGVFSAQRFSLVFLFVTAMTIIAGIAAVQRTQWRYPGVWWDGLFAIAVSSGLVNMTALLAVIRPEPWYAPQYAIPVFGMILGNSLTGISLGLDRFAGEIETRRDEAECLLALGASRWEAGLPLIRESARTGMIPIINSMTVVGIVSLPGMMTGQILAGQAPVEAVKYQMVILFLIAAGTCLGTVAAILLAFRRCFNSRHQLDFEGWRHVGGKA